MSAEENFQNTVIEPVYADGTSFEPSTQAVTVDLDGIGSALGYARQQVWLDGGG